MRQAVTAFVKAGVSDARTTDLAASWQAGLLVAPAFGPRRDSQLAFGVSQARFSARRRANARDAGVPIGKTETQFEITYSDRFSERFAIQPDLQYVANPRGRKGVRDAVVVTLCLVAGF